MIHRLNTRVNWYLADRKRTSDEQYIKDLPEQKAFEEGANFILELVFLYGLTIGIAFHELKKKADDAEKLAGTLDGIEQNIARVQVSIKENHEKKISMMKQMIIADRDFLEKARKEMGEKFLNDAVGKEIEDLR